MCARQSIQANAQAPQQQQRQPSESTTTAAAAAASLSECAHKHFPIPVRYHRWTAATNSATVTATTGTTTATTTNAAAMRARARLRPTGRRLRSSSSSNTGSAHFVCISALAEQRRQQQKRHQQLGQPSLVYARSLKFRLRIRALTLTSQVRSCERKQTPAHTSEALCLALRALQIVCAFPQLQSAASLFAGRLCACLHKALICLGCQHGHATSAPARAQIISIHARPVRAPAIHAGHAFGGTRAFETRQSLVGQLRHVALVQPIIKPTDGLVHQMHAVKFNLRNKPTGSL